MGRRRIRRKRPYRARSAQLFRKQHYTKKPIEKNEVHYVQSSTNFDVSWHRVL